MDGMTHEIRLAKWKDIITECQSRPEGQTVKQWTETNGIPEKQYYYWQRRVRTEIYGLIQKKLPCTKPADELSFAEFPMQESNVSASFRADAVVRTGNMTVELSNTVSEELLHRILAEVPHAV